MSKEPEIIINGINIGPGCAMTIRVALETFATDLIENGLGDDENGVAIKKNYLDRINDLREIMHQRWVYKENG